MLSLPSGIVIQSCLLQRQSKKQGWAGCILPGTKDQADTGTGLCWVVEILTPRCPCLLHCSLGYWLGLELEQAQCWVLAEINRLGMEAAVQRGEEKLLLAGRASSRVV